MLNQQTKLDRKQSLWLEIIRLLRWDRPAGRLILMIPALWSVFFAANAKPPIILVNLIILLSITSSAAGCAINDLWDRDIDIQVKRTLDRPLASRSLSINIAIITVVIALSVTVYLAQYLNPVAFKLLLASIPVIILYPLSKRFFPVPQLVMAIAWGFSILVGWSSVTGKLEFTTWLLWGATLLWAIGFDTVYALPDREDDRKIGINSSTIFFGKYVSHAVLTCFLGAAFLFACLGTIMNLKLFFWLILSLVTLTWIWQAVRIHNPNLPPNVHKQIFNQNVWIGFLLLLGIILSI